MIVDSVVKLNYEMLETQLVFCLDMSDEYAYP